MEQYSAIVMDTVVNGALWIQGGERQRMSALLLWVAAGPDLILEPIQRNYFSLRVSMSQSS